MLSSSLPPPEKKAELFEAQEIFSNLPLTEKKAELSQGALQCHITLRAGLHPEKKGHVLFYPIVTLKKFIDKQVSSPENSLPHHFVLVIDVSGSMDGRLGSSEKVLKLEALKEGFKEWIATLPAETQFTIITFSEEGKILSEKVLKEEALQAIAGLKSAGGTLIASGLKKLSPTALADLSHTDVYLFSDGEDIKGASPTQNIKNVRNQFRGKMPTIHPVGVGEDYNASTLREYGGATGNPFYHLGTKKQIKDFFDTQKISVSYPVEISLELAEHFYERVAVPGGLKDNEQDKSCLIECPINELFDNGKILSKLKCSIGEEKNRSDVVLEHTFTIEGLKPDPALDALFYTQKIDKIINEKSDNKTKIEKLQKLLKSFPKKIDKKGAPSKYSK